MMKTLNEFFFLLAVISALKLVSATPKLNRKDTIQEHHVQGSKRVVANTDNAFANDINKCLFTAWTTASGNARAVLSGPVQCKGQAGSAVQLCYGTEPPVAQFAVCYNTNTLTPDFTGHIVRGDIQGGGRESDWRADQGTFAPKPQSAISDYDPYIQSKVIDNVGIDKQYFCAKGHLTPNADFSNADQRLLTMITTNIAPQWQKFNSINWANLEEAIRTYTRNNNRDVYVFTGVGGKARNLKGDLIMLNGKVVAPRWYWKAVCDPVAQQSIVFVGENSIGIVNQKEVIGCDGTRQTKDSGAVYCHSLEGARNSHSYSDFKLPPFNEKNCKPSVKGDFMDNLLQNAFQ